jgi:hypothetical protein
VNEGVELGKIVKSDSHIRYTCQVFGQGEVPAPPRPEDFAFGGFVRVPLRSGPASLAGGMDGARADVAPLAPLGAPAADALAPLGDPGMPGAWAVGVIYDTILVNPAFGTLGPRLSNDEQVQLFSPDYLSERAVLISILLLGTMAPAPAGQNGLNDGAVATHAQARAANSHAARHGIPPVAPDLGAVVATLSEADVRAFHLFADGGPPGGGKPYLHMGYLPHIIAQDHPLLPLVALQIIERLERLFPANAALLSIMQRNFAWRLKVETAG